MYNIDDWIIFTIAILLIMLLAIAALWLELVWKWFCEAWDKHARQVYNKKHNKGL